MASACNEHCFDAEGCNFIKLSISGILTDHAIVAYFGKTEGESGEEGDGKSYDD